jgi:hypothetical protein
VEVAKRQCHTVVPDFGTPDAVFPADDSSCRITERHGEPVMKLQVILHLSTRIKAGFRANKDRSVADNLAYLEYWRSYYDKAA